MKTKILSLLLALASSRIAVAQTPTDSGFPNAARRPTKVFTEAVNWNGGVTYTYDGAGNIRSIGTDAQVYDAAGRLVQSSINGVTWQYSYDAFGNRKTCAGPGTDCQYGMTVARSSNRIDSAGVSYDAAGNMLSLGGRSYTWDAMDVLTSESGNGVNREFVYTADDERIAVYDVGSTWHWSARDPSGKVLRDFTSQDNGTAIATANWAWVKDYVYRDGLLVASRQKLPGNPTPVTWHYHLDHLGTPRRITTDSDAVIGSHTYHAFGPETSDGLNEPSLTRMKFTGHERDLEAGGGLVELDYMHARYYSAALGRFLSVDPVIDTKKALRAPQMWNRYSYVMNNPILYNDPTGKFAATTAGIERDLRERGLTDERDALVKYARTLSAQVKGGTLDSKKAVDMFWAKAKSLTGADKNISNDRSRPYNGALLVATGAALAIRGPVGNAMTRGSMGQDTLHHFFFNAYNSNDGVPAFVQAFGSNVILPTMREGRLTVEDDSLDRRANVRGAEFGSLIGWGYIDLQPSQVNCPSIQSGTCQ